MNTKPILLAYTTRYGSTQEVAETITAALRTTGLEVDVRPAREVQRVDQYAAVVLGAAIYGGRWHPEAHQFLSQHQNALTQRPVAVFALGPISPGSGAMKNAHRQLDRELEKYPWLKPAALEIFAGKYDPKKVDGFLEKFLPASDHRNWEAIRAWATALPEQLRHSGIPLGF